MLATYRPKPSRVKFKPHLYLDLNKKGSKKNQRLFSKNLKPNRKNRTKGVKLGFKYDRVAPGGFGVAPIKRVPTAMFSLVRIRPIFEQEAPK